MNTFTFFKPPGSLDKTLRALKTRSSSYWQKQGEKMALELFKFIYKTVPAYRALLKEKGINGNAIRTIEDFKMLPVIDKNTYLKKAPYLDLFPNRDLSAITTISATSGSSGEPFYFPRAEVHDAQYAYVAELFLKNQFELDKKSTLGSYEYKTRPFGKN